MFHKPFDVREQENKIKASTVSKVTPIPRRKPTILPAQNHRKTIDVMAA
jgi:hypothetical protein